MPQFFVYASLIGLCTGITLGEFWYLQFVFLALLTVVGSLCLAFPKMRVLGACLLACGLGWYSIQGARLPTALDVVRLVGKTITFEGVYLQPATHEQGRQQFSVSAVLIDGLPRNGSLLITTSAFTYIPVGSRLQGNCVLESISERSRWRLWSHGIHARCTSANITVLQHSIRSWRAQLGRWQFRVAEYVRQHYNEPQASLLNGILLGNTDGMSDRYLNFFQATGTTHIVALSGFNVTILVSAVMVVAVRLVGRRWAWLPALVLVVGFVIMCGASASVVRAASMASIVQLGLWLGRPIAIPRLLAYTAVCMLFDNPLLLWHDLGFQLSFLATIGLVALSAPLTSRLSSVPNMLGIRENLATTLGAILMTEPLLLWRFGRLSTIAPVVNIIVVPFIPIVMGIGSVSLLGLFWSPWSILFVPITDVVLRLILRVIELGAQVPQAMIVVPFIGTTVLSVGFSYVIWRVLRDHGHEIYPT